MTDSQYEHMSALMDSQQMNAESLDALVRNDELRTTWQHYHLISAMLRNEAKVGAPMDISAAVAAQVSNEPIVFAPKYGLLRNLQMKGWLKPAANIAIAASVALVTVLGVTQYQRIDDGTVVPNTPANRGYQPALQTVPLGVVGNPLSYNATTSPQAVTAQESLSAQEQARLHSQVQAFMIDHQLQLQWNGVEQEQIDKKVDEESEPVVKPIKPRLQ